MIGGFVRQVFLFPDHRSVLVRGTGVEGKDFLSVDIPLGAAPDIRPGDSVWWQGDKLLWSSKLYMVMDIPVTKLGYSYALSYLWQKVAKLCREGTCPECGHRDCMYDGEGRLFCNTCGASYDLSEVPVE